MWQRSFEVFEWVCPGLKACAYVHFVLCCVRGLTTGSEKELPSGYSLLSTDSTQFITAASQSPVSLQP